MTADSPRDPGPSGSKRRGGAWRWLVVGVLALSALLAVGIVPRMARRAELAENARAAEKEPLVTVVTPVVAPRTADLTLAGNIQAVQETAIYSRVDGYLKHRHADIGDRVEAGQVLAEIDTPELDQQLVQARATLAQAEAALAQARATLQQARASLQHNRATADYNRTNLKRWSELLSKSLVAQQDVDDRQVLLDSSVADVQAGEANVDALQASLIAAQANVDANRANVQRLLELQAYQQVRAPFAGVITVRNVDGGALITSGSTTTNTPMFRLAQTGTLRVFMNVPQTFMTSISPGLPVILLVREFPQRTFTGAVTSVSGALDPASRTLLTEIRVPNNEGILRPGMYGDVRLHIERTNPPLLIPSSALIIRAEGPRVVVVDANRKVRLQPVELGRDYGATVEVVAGLTVQDGLVPTPTEALRDGVSVRLAAARPAPGRPGDGERPRKGGG
ncbi:MAG TPA: efflux RND transporter periplasmic adaptor subunit [Candidatus Methylomirabilis sp.]|nr:efflux RND transporter periplasmic adaptor subunit [Candidatus Methylomirabilis sp.]